MDRDIKIFFDNRVVVLTDKNIKSFATDNHQVYVFENAKALSKELDRFEESHDECLCIVHPDLEELFQYVIACFKYIEAAGGLVTLPDQRILFIKRLGKWDLPKGKAEKNELLVDTALREVKEECGLDDSLQVTGELTHTYHTYYQKNEHILKHTAWYTMEYHGDTELSPQFEENITEAVWWPVNQMDLILQNTYESVKNVIAMYQNID